MKALIIGNQKRYEKFYPATPFADSVEKIYVSMETPFSQYPKEAFDADFLAADAIAKVPAELIYKMKNLKVIHSEGVGYNGIDCQAAAEHGVYVCNNRGINANAVAEQTVLLILGLFRQVIDGQKAVLEGRQIKKKEQMMIDGIMEIGDCSIGLIGFGDIGKAVARFLAPWGCKIFYHATKRKREEVEQEYHVTWMELPEMLKTCNIISLHVPVTTETAGMVDEKFLSSMRKDACLINTARGEIVDNEALIKALTEGWIAGAGLDTVAPEPVEADHPLLHLPEEVQKKILFSPHIGGVTTGTFVRAHRNIWNAFLKISMGEIPDNVVAAPAHR